MTPAMHPYPQPIRAARPGLSVVELLIALAISAMLLTATMVATDACFKAYADASEQFSTLAASRMVTNRLLAMVRTSTAHGPLVPQAATQVTLTDPDDSSKHYTATIGAVTLDADNVTLHSPYIEMLDPTLTDFKIAYLTYVDSAGTTRHELWLFRTPNGGTTTAQPLLTDVSNCAFTCVRTRTPRNVWYLLRATMDLSVQPGQDNTLAMENGTVEPVRFFASTKPRKLGE